MANSAVAPAKVNLALHLTGLRDDGYHLLDSYVVFADFGDVLSVSPADGLSLRVSGPFAAGVPVDGSNLVMKAAERLRDLRGVTAGAAITLEKHLPHGGGIGGGSSDAACAIRLLADLWGVTPLTSAEALPLGADVPVCLCAPDAVHMRGIGEDLAMAPPPPPGWLVLVNPRVPVPTGAAFALHDRLYDFSPLGLEPMDWGTDPEAFVAWLLGQRNDLTKVACEDVLAPVVGIVLESLRNAGAEVAEMSGSGSTCWGWYQAEDAARAAIARISSAHPDWWARASKIS